MSTAYLKWVRTPTAGNDGHSRNKPYVPGKITARSGTAISGLRNRPGGRPNGGGSLLFYRFNPPSVPVLYQIKSVKARRCLARKPFADRHCPAGRFLLEHVNAQDDCRTPRILAGQFS